jgi:hypothetical protein
MDILISDDTRILTTSLMAHPDFPNKKNSPTFIRSKPNKQIKTTPRLSKTTWSIRRSRRILRKNEKKKKKKSWIIRGCRPDNQTREKHAYLYFILDLHLPIYERCLAPFSWFLFVLSDPSASKFPCGICKEDITTSERAFFSLPHPLFLFFFILSLFYFSVQQQHFYLFSNKSWLVI